MTRTLLTMAVLAALAGPASAQSLGTLQGQPSAPPPAAPARTPLGIRAYFVVDANGLAATKSVEASLGSSQLTAFGGGGEVDLWKHLFLRFAASRMEGTGSRVFVDGGQVFDLGIPMTVTMMPIEAGAGWRFVSHSRFAPYVGGAFVSLGYQQVSDFAGSGDNLNERYTGSAVFGGVDVTVWKGIFVGGEAQIRHITAPDTSGSVMHEFGETDMGGFTARFLIGFSTK